MSKKTRRHHTPDQKIAMLRRHHIGKEAVSEICEDAELQPSAQRVLRLAEAPV